MLITKWGLFVIIFMAAWFGYFLAILIINRHVIGDILIDKSKPIDIYRIELDKPIEGKYSIFRNKEANLEPANETTYIIGGDKNG